MKIFVFCLFALVYTKCLPKNSSPTVKTPTDNTCIAMFDNILYDFQKFINVHPGGTSVIQELCSKTSENQILTQHANFQDQLKKANTLCPNCIRLV